MRYELKIALRYLRARRKDAFISVTTIFTAVGVMIGVAALIITLAVMGGFEQSLKERVLSLTPQVKIESSEGSIAKYGEIEKRTLAVPGVDGADAYVVGQGMLSSGRGIGSVVARGVEPDNTAVAKEWGRFVTEGTLAALAKDYPEPAQGGAAVRPAAESRSARDWRIRSRQSSAIGCGWWRRSSRPPTDRSRPDRRF